MTAVPRKREAAMSGVEIARRGGHAPSPLVARREALEAIRLRALDDISRSSDEAARLLELAAANPQMAAKPLLEAYGQGAVGPVRPKAWWNRNGCRVKRGERGLAVSMFGAYVFGRDQVVGPDPGGVGTRIEPPDALPDIGEPYGMAVLAARAGLRLRAEWSQPDPFTDGEPVLLRPAAVAPIPSVEVLERALAAVRAYDQAADSCLSCDGAGCVLCACQDDRESRRVSVQSPAKLPSVAKKKRSAKIGRPAKTRPDRIASVVAGLEEAARIRAEADRMEAAAKVAVSTGIRSAQESGYSLRDIAASMGVSLTRVVQLRDAG